MYSERWRIILRQSRLSKLRHKNRDRTTGNACDNCVRRFIVCTGEKIVLNGLKPSTVYLLSVAAVNDVGVGRPRVVAAATADLR
jgi:hypothetical protein